VLLALLSLAWIASPHPVPLYDGIGFPDQPYRYVPPRGGTPPATAAVLSLRVSGGTNSGGLIGNSTEVGPQVSFYAPPQAFAVTGSAPIAVAARPVPLAPPNPPGVVDSNDYALTFTSPDGPVTVKPDAQPAAMTMRSGSAAPNARVMEYRASGGTTWRELKTRQVGRDIFTANAPGAGDYVLVDRQGASSGKSTSRTGLYGVVGATVVLLVLVLVGVRVLSRRRPEQ
jgi:hypothetical protein